MVRGHRNLRHQFLLMSSVWESALLSSLDVVEFLVASAEEDKEFPAIAKRRVAHLLAIIEKPRKRRSAEAGAESGTAKKRRAQSIKSTTASASAPTSASTSAPASASALASAETLGPACASVRPSRRSQNDGIWLAAGAQIWGSFMTLGGQKLWYSGIVLSKRDASFGTMVMISWEDGAETEHSADSLVSSPPQSAPLFKDVQE